jgi:glycosyltransferase involved in cell wall biosynthesis
MLRYPELLFPPADAQAIVDRLVQLHDDVLAYEHVRSLCRQRRSYFDFDWAGEFVTVLAEIVRSPSGIA